jgi:hypothetical protein
MRRLEILTLTVLAVVLVAAPGAVAKGAGGASLTGPGLDEPVDFGSRGANRIASFSGLYNNGGVGTEAHPGDRELGPAYELSFEFTYHRDFEIVQQVYPYASDGPWIFTPQQEIYDREIGPFWTQTSDFFLRRLVREGLPTERPESVVDERVAPPSQTDSTTLPWTMVAVAALLLGGIAISLRLRATGAMAQK